MKKALTPNEYGFSLLEATIYLAFLSLILVVLVPSFYSLKAVEGRVSDTSIDIENFLFTELQMRHLLKYAKTIISPSPNNFSDELRLVIDTESDEEEVVQVSLEDGVLNLNSLPLHDSFITPNFIASDFFVSRQDSDTGIFEKIEFRHGAQIFSSIFFKNQ